MRLPVSFLWPLHCHVNANEAVRIQRHSTLSSISNLEMTASSKTQWARVLIPLSISPIPVTQLFVQQKKLVFKKVVCCAA